MATQRKSTLFSQRQSSRRVAPGAVLPGDSSSSFGDDPLLEIGAGWTALNCRKLAAVKVPRQFVISAQFRTLGDYPDHRENEAFELSPCEPPPLGDVLRIHPGYPCESQTWIRNHFSALIGD